MKTPPTCGAAERFSRHYGYDASGNRRSAVTPALGTVNYTSNNTNAYTMVTGDQPAYDANGNTTRLRGRTLAWDRKNRMRSNGGIKYVYDALGRMVQRKDTATGETIRYSWSGWLMLGERKKDSSGAEIEYLRYTWGADLTGTLEGAGTVGGLLMVERFAGGSGTAQVAHVHPDANGNTMGLTSDTGTVLTWYRYHPFGTLESSGGNAGWLSWNRFTFSTKWHDPVTGLHYYGYRWYDPVAGRWPSRDPIEEEGGLNLYAFVENDAVNTWDLLGMKKTKDPYEMSMAGATLWGMRANNPFQYGTMYRSRSWGTAKRDIKKYFDQDNDGKLTEKDCPPFRIRVVGYSWGGWSSLILVKKLASIAEKPNEHYKIALGTLDPVKTGRGAGGIAAGGLPPYVVKAFNAYQRNGMRVQRGFNWLLKNKFRGESVAGAVNINATNVKLLDWRVKDKNGNLTLQLVDHATIAWRAGGGRSVYAQWVLDSVKQVPLK